MKVISVAAVAAAFAVPSAAFGEDATYDENQNWLNAWGQTQKDFTDPGETAGTVINSAANAATNARTRALPSRAPTSSTTGPGPAIPTASCVTPTAPQPPPTTTAMRAWFSTPSSSRAAE